MKHRIICMILAATFIFASCGIKKSVPTSQIPQANDTIVEDQVPKDTPKEPEVIPPTESTHETQDTSALNKTEKSWFYTPKSDGTPSGAPADALALLNKYQGYYLGDTSKKVLYLTFDEGYENGYTSKILDILKETNVKAAFFVTKPYITSNKELIKRMASEGHLVCNHSNTHPSMAQAALKGQPAFNKEFTDTEAAYTEVTGKPMPKFFRPPMGNYSELSMYYTKALGYKTIFWSFAYKDWEVDKQPSESYATNLMRERSHSGAIVLLHAVSKTNTNVLDSMLKEWKGKGFEFKTLNDLPAK